MADKIRQVDYYYVEIPDKPGEGARVLSGLKDAGVNLVATCGFPTAGGKTQIDLVPENPDALRDAAKKLSLKLSDRKRAFVIDGQDRVGAVAEVLGKLAKDGINVHAAQAVTAGSGRYGMILWVKPADHDKARRSLGA